MTANIRSRKEKNVLGNLRLEALFSKHTVYCGEVSLDSLGFFNFFLKKGWAPMLSY